VPIVEALLLECPDVLLSKIITMLNLNLIFYQQNLFDPIFEKLKLTVLKNKQCSGDSSSLPGQS